MMKPPTIPAILAVTTIVGILFGFACVAESHSPSPPASSPNVILVMTDDQGYGDLSCHGNLKRINRIP